jgi:hypothetical protein
MIDMLRDIFEMFLAYNIVSILPNVAASAVLVMKYGTSLNSKSIWVPFAIYAGSYVLSAFLLSMLLSPFLLFLYIFAGPIFLGVGFLFHLFIVRFVA